MGCGSWAAVSDSLTLSLHMVLAVGWGRGAMKPPDSCLARGVELPSHRVPTQTGGMESTLQVLSHTPCEEGHLGLQWTMEII